MTFLQYSSSMCFIVIFLRKHWHDYNSPPYFSWRYGPVFLALCAGFQPSHLSGSRALGHVFLSALHTSLVHIWQVASHLVGPHPSPVVQVGVVGGVRCLTGSHHSQAPCFDPYLCVAPNPWKTGRKSLLGAFICVPEEARQGRWSMGVGDILVICAIFCISFFLLLLTWSFLLMLSLS